MIYTRAFSSFSHSFLFIAASWASSLSYGQEGNEAGCEQRGITLYIVMRKPVASFDFGTVGNSCLKRSRNSGFQVLVMDCEECEVLLKEEVSKKSCIIIML